MTALASRRPDLPGRQALSLYSDADRSTRLHTLVRWWSAPFPAIERALPETGRILEIGCGHGLFSAYAALSASGRSVHGVDIDPDKIVAARSAARNLQERLGDQPGARLDFAEAPSGAVPDGPWDAVVVVDVLYLLSEEEQRRLLLEALSTVTPGGVLVVKEMAPEPRWKARWNSTQETLAVRVLRHHRRAPDLRLRPAVADRLLAARRGRHRAGTAARHRPNSSAPPPHRYFPHVRCTARREDLRRGRP